MEGFHVVRRLELPYDDMDFPNDYYRVSLFSLFIFSVLGPVYSRFKDCYGKSFRL